MNVNPLKMQVIQAAAALLQFPVNADHQRKTKHKTLNTKALL